ncbi:hypothetical protein OROHE_016882 [Orobanche hederae]
MEEQKRIVTPWEVAGEKGRKIDYDKLIDKFGCQRIDQSLIDRFARINGWPAHVFLRRGVFFAHRDLSDLLDAYERGEKFYLYTGRGPSSEALHLGHLVPFMFTKYLQEAFKVPLVVQLTDDEKCMWKNLPKEECKRLARENAKDIIACGFDISRTFIFSDYDFVGGSFYENLISIAMCVTYNKAVGIFGFSGEDHIGKVIFPAVQLDIPIKYLGFFLEDDAELEHITREYGAGRMLTGEVKKRLIEVLTELVERHSRARAAVTDEMVDAFMAVRPLPYMFS